MSWIEALEINVARWGCERLRVLCADTWPDHEGYRSLMVQLATGQPVPTPADRALQAHVAAHPCGSC